MAVLESGGSNLYETNDSGSTWRPLFQRQSPEGIISVYAIDSLIFAIDNIIPGMGITLLESSNDGFSWQQYSSVMKPELITGNRESLLEAGGVSGADGGANIFDVLSIHSSDLGINWTLPTAGPAFLDVEYGVEAWNQFVIPHSQTIVLAMENLDYSATSLILVSTDGGTSWNSTFQDAPDFTINAVSGDGCAVYVQRTLADSN